MLFARQMLMHPFWSTFLLVILLICKSSSLVCAQTQPRTALETKNVLVLHSFEPMAPVFLGTDEGLTKTLLDGGIPIQNQFFVSLDLRRNSGPAYRRLMVEQMHMMSIHRKLDVIVTMYPEALEFVVKDCRDIFPDIPILAMYLPAGFELPKTNTRIIGHSAARDILGTFEIALKLVPGAKRVYVVSRQSGRSSGSARSQEMGKPA